MNNLDVLLEPVPASQRLCKLGRVIDSLDEPYKSALVNLVNTSFDDGGLNDRQLTERLAKAGIRVGVTVVYYHRVNSCNCHKKVVVG